ncbi:MAG: hypothetical protein H6Q90_5428 [Deltaproteobacteria bacterium]|nr:hypothetical protein [Deltaproteobacteria bacterium]
MKLLVLALVLWITSLTISAPVRWPKRCARGTGTLELLARAAPGPVVEIGLHNAGRDSLCIQAPAGECVDSEAALQLTLDPATPATRRFAWPMICYKTTLAPIVWLPPGATWWERVKVAGSAARGLHRVEVGYEMPAVTQGHSRRFPVWAGKLTATVDVMLP